MTGLGLKNLPGSGWGAPKSTSSRRGCSPVRKPGNLQVPGFPGGTPHPSLLTCLCRGPVEDLERNDGSQDRPYYMSKSLMKILGKKNKASPEAKKRKK